MPNPYASSLKLTKELEAKAKEIKKIKEKCEDLISKIDPLIKVLETFNIDTSKKQYSEAHIVYNDKNYTVALQLFNKVFEDITSSEHAYFESIRSNLNRLIRYFDVFKIENVSLKEKANNAFEQVETDPIRANETLRGVLKDVENKILDKVVEKSNFAIAEMENLEETKKKEFELNLEEVSTLIHKKDVASAAEKIEVIIVEMSEFKKEGYTSLIKNVLELEKAAEFAKLGLKNIINIKKQSEKEYQNGNMSASIQLLENYRNKLKNELTDFAKKVIEIARVSAKDATSMGADVADLLEQIEEMSQSLESGKYTENLEKLREITVNIEKSKFQAIFNLINSTREEILKAKESRLDISSALEHLEKARDLLKQNKYTQAHDEVREGLNSIKRAIDLKNQVKDELNNIKNILETLNSIPITIENIDTSLAEAQENMDKNPELAFTLASNVKKQVENAIHSLNLRLIDESYDLIKIFEKNRIGVETIKLSYDRALEYYQSKEYVESVKMLKQLQTEMDKVAATKIEECLTDSEKYRKDDEEFNKKLEEKIENIRTMVSGKGYIQAFATLDSLSDLVWQDKKSKYLKRLGEMEEYKNILKNNDVSVAEITAKLAEIEESIKNRNENIEFLFVEQEALLMDSMRELVRKNYDLIKVKISVLAKFGVDVNSSKFSEIMDRILENLDTNNVLEALNLTLNTKKEIDEAVEKTEDLFSEIIETVQKIGYAKEIGLETTELAKRVYSARLHLERCELDQAYSEIESAKATVTDFISLQNITQLKEYVLELEKVARTLDINGELIDKIGEFKKLIDSKQYAESVRLSNLIKEKYEEPIESQVVEYFQKIENEIDDFKAEADTNFVVNLDLGIPKNYFLEGNYAKAVETLKDLESKIYKLISTFRSAKDNMVDLKRQFRFADLLNFKLNDTQLLYQDAKSSLEQGKIGEALSVSKQALRKASSELKVKIGEILADIRNDIQKLKRKNMSTIVADNIITSAERMLQEGNSIEALKKGLSALDEIEKISVQKDMAFNTVQYLTDLIKNNISFIPDRIIEEQKRVRKLFDTGKYTNCIEECLKLSELVLNNISVVGELKKYIEQVKKNIILENKLEINTKEQMNYFNQARDKFASMDYVESLSIIRTCLKDSSARILDKTLKRERQFRKVLDKAKGLDMDKNLTQMIERLNSPELGLEEIFSLQSMIENAVNENIVKVAEKKYNILMENIRMLKNESYSLSDLESATKELKREIEGKDLDKIASQIFAVEEAYDEELSKFIKIQIRTIRERVSKYQKPGLVLEMYLESTPELLKLVEASDLDLIIEKLHEIKENIDNDISKYLKAIVDEKLSKLDHVETDSVKLLKKDIDLALKNKKFDTIYNYYSQIDAMYDKYLERVELAKNELNKAKQRLTELLDLHLNMDEQIKKVNKAVLLVSKNPDLVLSELREIFKDLDSTATQYRPQLEITVTLKSSKDNVLSGEASILNNGSSPISDLSLNISGLVTLNTPVNIKNLIPKNKISKEMSLVASANSGELKIEVSAKNQEGKVFRTKESYFLDLVRDQGFELKKATGTEKCEICRGKLAKGMDALYCEIGDAVYHIQCAKRAGKCIKCKKQFYFEDSPLGTFITRI